MEACGAGLFVCRIPRACLLFLEGSCEVLISMGPLLGYWVAREVALAGLFIGDVDLEFEFFADLLAAMGWLRRRNIANVPVSRARWYRLLDHFGPLLMETCRCSFSRLFSFWIA